MKKRFDVTGMTCSACSSHVEKSVSKLEGVNEVSVNLLTNSMQVQFEESMTGVDTIIKAVEDSGYGASLAGGNEKNGTDQGSRTANQNKKEHLDSLKKDTDMVKLRLLISAVCLIPLMYLSMGHMIYGWLHVSMPDWYTNTFYGTENALINIFTQLLLVTPILFANQKYYRNGFKTLFRRSPNMDSLIAIGSGAAVVYGIFVIYRISYGFGHNDLALVQRYSHDLYFESAGMILTLITFGKFLESRSKGKTSEAITKLMDLAPKTVNIIRDHQEINVDVSEVVVGDLYVIKPGESIAVDGVIVEGRSSFDESAITGESIPVSKQEGDRIISASINQSGRIIAKAEKVGDDTTIAQIIRLVEEASASKAPIAKIADKIAGVFVPIVMGIALVTGVIWLISGAGFEFAMSCAIAVLVISCPCALGLATPVAIMVGTGKGAQNGILIKSGEALQTAHQLDTVVLDKTGTITSGKPVVTDIICMEEQGNNSCSKEQLLTIAGSLEKGSEHPLAEAILQHCKELSITLTNVENFEALFGLGVQGSVNGTAYFAGNEKLMEQKGLLLQSQTKNVIHELSVQGKTPMIFSDQSRVIGIIAVADVVKSSSRQAVEQLKKYGIHVIMLTGDNEVTAKAIQSQVGIDEVVAGVLPEGKEKKIRELRDQGHCVAMIGDGVNDAPALASADVGIAIGAGTDVAIESADIVLMRSDLLDVAGTVKLSRAVIRNIKENLFWAFFYNCIGIPLAAGALYPVWGIKLSPMFGAAAMSLSSIFVVGNALRLRSLRLKQDDQIPQDRIDASRKNQEDYISQDDPANQVDQTKQDDPANQVDQKEHGDQNRHHNKERKEEKKMKKIILKVEGMSCGHCSARVEKALSAVEGVTEATVSLEEKTAIVTAADEVAAEQLKDAVTEAGYDVVGIE